MHSILNDLVFSVSGFLTGVGVTVLFYRLRGYDIIAKRRE